MKHFCYYHDDADGLGAAYAVKQAYNGEKMEFTSVNYGSDQYHVTEFTPETHIFIVDFCPKPETIVKLCHLAGQVVIIDHHKTSIADVNNYFDGAGWPENLKFVADPTVSGCELAWRYFDADSDCPRALAYIGDRDMWKFELADSKAINAWIAAQPPTLKDITRVVEDLEDDRGLGAVADMGNAIMQADQRYLEKLLKRVRPVTLDGYRGVMVNTAHLGSEMGNFILTRPEFAELDFAALTFEADGKTVVSLRSRKGSQVDVSAIAKKRGGGGHFNAAGYEMPFTINLA